MPIELPYDRREPIERAVVRLYEEYGVRSLPLDPFDLARNMKIDVVAYQNLTNDSSVLKTLEQTSGDGFTLFDPSRMRYRILYNSDYSAASMTRRRFTIAHEIGHIWLEHSDSSRNELEADYFAGYLLAPHPLDPQASTGSMAAARSFRDKLSGGTACTPTSTPKTRSMAQRPP